MLKIIIYKPLKFSNFYKYYLPNTTIQIVDIILRQVACVIFRKVECILILKANKYLYNSKTYVFLNDKNIFKPKYYFFLNKLKF